ncbi:MAG: alanyl-tRNA editing protein [Promethearchaeota archaeon]
MTEALYLKDSYLRTWTAKVKKVKDGKYIVLEKTAFYPNGGGQPWDEGFILKNDQKFKIVHVGKLSGEIIHEVDKIGLVEGDEISCELDWERRFALMRHHTAAHLLSAIIYRNYNAKITGNQLGADKSRMDFSMKDYSREKLIAAVNEANEIIKMDVLVKIFYISRKEFSENPSLSRLAIGLPKNIKDVRVVKIGDIDVQADGGTHVKSLKEIGKIEFLKTENKGKNNRRLYFSLKE